MRLNTRLIVLFLAITLLAACSGPSATPGAQTAVPAASATPTRVQLARFSPEPAVAQASATPAPTRLPHLKEPLVWLLRSENQPDLALVNEELNQRLAQRAFNARVELRFVDPLRFAAALAAYPVMPDLLTTGGAAYESGAAAGQFWPITPTDAPTLWAAVPAQGWQAVRRAGQVYAVPAQGRWAQPYGVAIRADVLAALELESPLNALTSFNDLTALLETIQAALAAKRLDPAIRTVLGPVDLLRPEAAGYEPLAAHFVVSAQDASGQVVNWLQTPAVAELANLRRAWHTAGFEPARVPDPQGWLDLCEAGRFAVVVGSLGQPQRCGLAWVEKPLAPLFLSTSAISETMTAVGSTQPERARRALLLLEILHADPELYNLLARGIQGRHWQWDSGGEIIQLLPEAGYQPAIAAQLGRPDLLYPTSSDEAQAWQQVRAWNDAALESPALGFRFDPRAVAGPLAAMRGLERELAGPLFAGQAQDPAAAVRRLNEQMEALGTSTLAAELVRQLAAWRASR